MIDPMNTILKDHRTTLKETSKDTSNNEFMTESTLDVNHFDNITRKHIEPLVLSGVKSNDALFRNENGKFWFIEFKNGVINHNEINDIKLKIFHSLFIFIDILKETTDFTRENVGYVLVYNQQKNSRDEVKATREAKKRIRKEKIIRFGLGSFEGTYFKDVCTYHREEFECKFIKKHAVNGHDH